jgi:hypothetical protein
VNRTKEAQRRSREAPSHKKKKKKKKKNLFGRHGCKILVAPSPPFLFLLGAESGFEMVKIQFC